VRKRPLRTIAMLPTLLTLGNLYFGFAAVYFCGRELEELGAGREPATLKTLQSVFFETRAPSFLCIAVWMVAAGMACDALDGRVARRANVSSRFGEQLDSLADVVTFGLAPAVVMVTMIHRELTHWGGPPFGFVQYGPVAVFIGAIYVCCAALRLARFNVETSIEQAAHEGFRGLPSPGAAGALLSLVYLHDRIEIFASQVRTATVIAQLLPVLTLILALLMVSRVPYRHAVSAFLRRRPFSHVILVILVIPFVLLYPAPMLALVAWFFVISGPIRYLWQALTGGSDRPREGDAGDDRDQDDRPDTELRQHA
jgi:CDP-diacylglycerol--serine O-phosphatidyltransferase